MQRQWIRHHGPARGSRLGQQHLVALHGSLLAHFQVSAVLRRSVLRTGRLYLRLQGPQFAGQTFAPADESCAVGGIGKATDSVPMSACRALRRGHARSSVPGFAWLALARLSLLRICGARSAPILGGRFSGRASALSAGADDRTSQIGLRSLRLRCRFLTRVAFAGSAPQIGLRWFHLLGFGGGSVRGRRRLADVRLRRG